MASPLSASGGDAQATLNNIQDCHQQILTTLGKIQDEQTTMLGQQWAGNYADGYQRNAQGSKRNSKPSPTA